MTDYPTPSGGPAGTADPHTRAAEPVAVGAPVEAQYVRGGRKGTRATLILGVSVLAAALVMVIVFLANSGRLAESQRGAAANPAEASTFQTSSTPAVKTAPDRNAGSPVADNRGQ